MALLFVANTINVGADLAAMGEAANLVTGLNQHGFTIFFALVSLGLQLFMSLGLAGWAGHWLDGVFGFQSLFLILFLFLMFAGIMYKLYRSNQS